MNTTEKPPAMTARAKRFADLHLSGMPAGRAYTKAGYSATGNSAEAAASRLLRNVQVSRYIVLERKRMQGAGEIERDEIVGFLAKVLRTPVGEVTEGSVLAQEYTDEVSETGARKRVKMVGKMDAVKQLCTMLG
jgi:phage terminase small subunit